MGESSQVQAAVPAGNMCDLALEQACHMPLHSMQVPAREWHQDPIGGKKLLQPWLLMCLTRQGHRVEPVKRCIGDAVTDGFVTFQEPVM